MNIHLKNLFLKWNHRQLETKSRLLWNNLEMSGKKSYLHFNDNFYSRTDSSVGKKLSTKKQKRSASADKAAKKPAKKRKPKTKAKPTPPSSPIKPDSEPESQGHDSGPEQSNDSSPLSQIQSDQSDWDNGFWCEAALDWSERSCILFWQLCWDFE